MPTPKPALRLSLSDPMPDEAGKLLGGEDVEIVPGQDEFVNPVIKDQYVERLKVVRAEMVAVPGLREITDMALERATFLYYKMRDLEQSGVLNPKTAAKMKLWFGIYEKLLGGWVKINDELYRQARQLDQDVAFKQSFIGQVSTVLKNHLDGIDAARVKAITDDLAKLAM